jgi:hypothetical protein
MRLREGGSACREEYDVTVVIILPYSTRVQSCWSAMVGFYFAVNPGGLSLCSMVSFLPLVTSLLHTILYSIVSRLAS